ncbi:MAG TPA: FtsQ-type POTRA domain-containing protein, partial [Candidatus Acidoferrales bacterium]|nr:FtsQ-type POTRA domain-containing protein [Candidatus Acidoferrales bacterium]
RRIFDWRKKRLRVPPRLRLGLLAALCGVSASLAVFFGAPPGWRAIKRHPYFAVDGIELSGNRRLNREDVLQLAGWHSGMSVWDASPSDARLRLASNPWIEWVSVERQLPRHLGIRVRERRPMAIVQIGGLQYVDRGGRVLGPLRDDDSRDLPIITGIDSIDSKSFGAVALHRALQLVHWCERLRCFDTISEVRVDREAGITVFPLKTAVPVVLGWGGWREKLVRSARVFAAWQGQTDRLAQIDVSYHNQVVVRLRDDKRPSNGRPSKRGTRV